MAQKHKASKKKPAKQKIQPVEEILFRVEGKMSTFGGPKDTGMLSGQVLRPGALASHDRFLGRG